MVSGFIDVIRKKTGVWVLRCLRFYNYNLNIIEMSSLILLDFSLVGNST